MVKLNRDEELYRLVKPIIDNFRFEDSKPGEDIESILRNKIRYDSLQQRVSWVDENLLTKKDRIKELISAKEESALYDLGFLDIEIAKNPVLNRRLADIGLSRIHDKKEKRRLDKLWAKGQLSTGTLFFDDSLTAERTNRTVKGKDGKTYQRSGTNEAVLNDRLRQLSDAVHPDIENTVNDLREAYVDVTGMEAKNYKIPGTTYLRESVVLRTKIGKALVEKEDLASDFHNADPNYQYRFLADRWLKQKDNSNFVLKDFLQKQLKLVTGDKNVLESYKEVAQRLKQEGKIVADIKISDKLSVHDQIQQYRKALSGNVYDVVDVMPRSSPVYLDLVTSQKNSNPELYKATIKELSDEKVSSLPQQMFEDINKYRSEEKSRLFSSSVSQEEFSEAWKSKGWLRRLVDYREVKKKDGSSVMVPVGITRFNDQYYRNDFDKKKLEEDFLTFIGDSKERISAAKQKIISVKESRIEQLQKDIEDRKQKNLNTSKKEELLNKLTERLDAFKSKDYSYSSVGSLDKRAAIIKAAAEELTIKANILEQDPVFNFNRVLRDVKREDRISALEGAEESLRANVRDVRTYQQQYNEKGFGTPHWLADKSVHDQLMWYRDAGALMFDISRMDHDTFTSWVSKQDYGALKRKLPVGYLQKIKGAVYRSDAESDIIEKLHQDFNRFKEREQRVMEGPAKVTPSTKLNSFGNLLQQQTGNIDMVPINQVAQLDSKKFSSAYRNLSDQQKKLYDYNYGKPVEAKGVFYRSVYDIPDKIWEEEEKAAGFSKPRQRGQAVVNYDINVAQEEELQKKITEDLKNRSWESPVKEKTVSKALTESVSEQQFLEQEARENLEKMLSVSREKSKTVKLGGMGIMAAFALFNIAMTGPSREAEEHKRRVEEERKRKMYGY